MAKGGKERMINLQRYDKNAVPWSARQLLRSMENGVAKFDNAVQRSFVWTKEQKSLFIHSMIINAPIPPLYASKRKEGKTNVYDFMDGKQRSNCIKSFFNNEFELVEVPKVYDVEGNAIDYNGMKFEDLPEDIQDFIGDYSLTIYSFDSLDDDDFADIFYRLNMGTALKPIERNFAKMPSRQKITEIAKHPLFEIALTQASIEKKTDIDIIIKSLIMLKQPEPNLDARNVKTFALKVELTEEDVQRINNIYDRILEISQAVEERELPVAESVKNAVIARRIRMRGHIITLVPFIENHMDDPFLADFLHYFFSGSPQASISERYNAASGSGSGHKENVELRENELEKEYQKYTKKMS